MGLFELPSSALIGQAGRARVIVLRQNSFFSGKPQSLPLRPSIDWMRPTHIMGISFT